MASTSWVVAQSEQALKQRINSHSHQVLKNNINSKHILPRRLKFIGPTRQQNARPMTSNSMSSTSSSTPPTQGRQRSEFKPAAQQLFDESNIPQLMDWKKSMHSTGSGLRNLGNSCFMNATLQCLCYTPPFINYINTKHHIKNCKTSGYCIFCELQKFIPKMLYSQSAETPRIIFKNLRSLSRKLRPGRQEDAQEFLRFLMEGLQNSCLKQEGRKITDMRIQETTLIHKIWGGYLRSQIKCCKCGYESNTYDSILDISLEIKGPSLNTALKHFTDPEILDDDNKYFCDNCKKKRRAIKQFTIFEAPNILIIHLKRFENNSGHGLFSGGKINNHIQFDIELDITQYMSYNICPKVSYSLFGVLIHYGYSSHGGHYVSYIKSPNGQWYLMDDSRCQMVNINIVLKEKAYLLFYKRNEEKVLYKSPTNSPNINIIKNKNKKKINSISSFDSLQQLANLLPNTASMFEKTINTNLTESPIMRHQHKRTPSSSEISTPRSHNTTTRNTKPLISNNKSISMDTNSSSDDIKMKIHKSISKTSTDALEWQQNNCGEKRKFSLDNNGNIKDNSPLKKRKLNRKKQLQLLKQRLSLSKGSNSITNSSSSSPSYNKVFYTGRRSHTLSLSAKYNTLNNTCTKQPKLHKPWNRKLIRRASQIPTPSVTMHKFKKTLPHAPLSDSSSESVLSDNKTINNNSFCDSSVSISPRNIIYSSPKPPTNTILPPHDGSSPHTLIPINKRVCSIIKDENIIYKYLNNNESLSAIGISDIGTWTDKNNGNNIRDTIIKISNKPIVEPKDEWDIALDGGLAYPHKSKVKKDPFKNFNRDKSRNFFQIKQNNVQNGFDKLKKNKKKKGSFHNKNRYHNRFKNNNSIQA